MISLLDFFFLSTLENFIFFTKPEWRYIQKWYLFFYQKEKQAFTRYIIVVTTSAIYELYYTQCNFPKIFNRSIFNLSLTLALWSGQGASCQSKGAPNPSGRSESCSSEVVRSSESTWSSGPDASSEPRGEVSRNAILLPAQTWAGTFWRWKKLSS